MTYVASSSPKVRSRATYPPATSLTGPIFDLDLSGVEVVDLRPNKAEITNCDFTRTRLGLGHFNDVVFTDCDFTGATFLGTRISGASFVRCDLTRTNFESASLLNVTTKDCDFSRSILYDAYVDESFPLPLGYVRSTVAVEHAPELARVYVDAKALCETAQRVGIDPDVAVELFLEHHDIAPQDLFAMMSAIKAQP